MGFPWEGLVTFGRSPRYEEVDRADVVVLGVPYDGGVGFRPGCRFGPRAIREASTRFDLATGRYIDPERGTAYLEAVAVADGGDVPVSPYQYDTLREGLLERLPAIRRDGALPVILGGDHSLTFAAVEALSQTEGLAIVQIDAHLDFNDQTGGNRYANSCPMRRASELAGVEEIFCLGLRGLRHSEEAYRAAEEWGMQIATLRDVRTGRAGTLLESIPEGSRLYLTVDLDVLDPAIAPGVNSPEPDGLTYREVVDLAVTAGQRGKVVGLDLVEINPLVDPGQTTGFLAANLLVELLSYLL